MTFNVAQLLTSVAAATVAASTAAASSFSQCICEVKIWMLNVSDN